MAPHLEATKLDVRTTDVLVLAVETDKVRGTSQILHKFVVTVNDDQQDATIWAYYLFLISSTCFGRCLRPSSGARECIYSF